MGKTEGLIEELTDIAARYKGLASGYSDVESKCDAIEAACDGIAGSFSGSFLGYHSRVYYLDFKLPPPKAYFDVEGGLQHEAYGSGTRGDWIKMNKDTVLQHLLDFANVSDMPALEKLKRTRIESFGDIQTRMLSVFARHEALTKNDSFLQEQAAKATELDVRTVREIGQTFVPKRTVKTRDTLAVQEGLQAPPHLVLKAQSIAIREPFLLAVRLEKIIRSMIQHLQAVDVLVEIDPVSKVAGSKIFIGHGHSQVWRELKDFLKDDLRLEPDEFNRQPAEGRLVGERLSQMLDEACFAFIVFTAEDDRGDAKVYPRLNVVHEAGLFQGRLGFKRAILLVEDGCEKFSNIDGLVVLQFSSGRIDGTFDKIRRLLKAEGILP